MKILKKANKPLNVQFAPIFNKKMFKTQIVSNTGEEIKISPVVFSNPPVSTYSWYKLIGYWKKPLPLDSKYTLNNKKDELKVLATREKLIKLQVKAENELGWNLCNITLDIMCKFILKIIKCNA